MASRANGTTFPWLAVIILAICMTVHSYTLANVYPYVGVMTKCLLGLSSMNEAGYYAGYMASAFTFGRLISGYFWGSIADEIGRKPVIILSLSSIAVCSVVFGLSTSFTMAVTSRFILGMTNGIMTALRTTTQEICGPSQVLRGMTYVSTSRGAGIVIGTGIGGLLAQPALAYPTVFSPTGFFAKFPFFCPNLFGAVLALLVLPLVVFFLPETRFLEKQKRIDEQEENSMESALRKYQDSGASTETEGRFGNGKGSSVNQLLENITEGEIAERGEMVHTFDGENVEARNVRATPDRRMINRCELVHDGHEMGRDSDACKVDDSNSVSGGGGGGSKSVMEMKQDEDKSDVSLFGPNGLLSSSSIWLILVMVALVQTLSIGFDEVYPLWALTSTDVGGLGWTILQVGKVLTLAGVLAAVIAIAFFPTIIQKVGIVKWQRSGCLLGIAISIATPYAKRFSWNENSLFLVTLATNYLFNCGIMMNMLPLTMASTSIVEPHQRGRLGGLFMTAESVGRTMGPVSFSNVLAWSISSSSDLVDFHFVFFLAAAIMGLIAVLGWFTLTPDLFSAFSKVATRRGETAVVAESGKLLTKQPPSDPTLGECALPETGPETQEDRYRQTFNARESTKLLVK